MTTKELKTENESTPVPPTATPAYAAYQHYQAYAGHYPQASYGHYTYGAAVAPQPAPAAASSSTVQRPVQNQTNIDTSDIATLNDALGSAGVDLRAETETLQRTHEQQNIYRSFEDRTRKQPPTPSFDTRFLSITMSTVGTEHKITKIPDDATNYMALALRARLQDLITAMIVASRHRTDTQFDRPASHYEDGSPMWSIVVRSDVAKQLAALEKVEREEETRVRRERKERHDMAAAHAAALAAQANGTAPMATDGFNDEGTAKKKRKKEGPGVTARNMSEDVRKKMSNAVATQAAGLGGKYAWMNAASTAAAPAPKPKPATTTTVTTSAMNTTTSAAVSVGTSSPNPVATTTPATTTTPVSMTASSSWARPYVLTKKSSTPQAASEEEDTRTLITMRDAMFVIEKERGHGGGRGAARGWV